MGDRSHITYTRGRCAYVYADGERCLYDGQLLDGMCAEHRMIHQKREQAKRHRAKSKGEAA